MRTASPSFVNTLAAAVLAGALVACGGGTSSTAPAAPPAAAPPPEAASAPRYPMTVTNCGEPVTLEEVPARVLTVGSPAADLMHAAGAADRIVGRSGEFGAPPQGDAAAALADVPVVDPSDPTLEAIIGSGADMVIGYGLFNTTAEDLSGAGIANLTTTGDCSHDGATGQDEASGFDAVYTDIQLYGQIFGTEQTAAAAIERYRARLSAVAEEAADKPSMTAAGVYFYGPSLSVTGRRSVVHDQLETLNLTDAFADLDEAFLETNAEELIRRDPDVLVLRYGFEGESAEQARSMLLDLPGAEDLTAVRNDRVVMLPSALGEVGPAAVDGVEQLAGALRRQG